MEEVTQAKRRCIWELLYANDLVVKAKNEDAINRYRRWKTGLEKRGLNMNILR